MNEVGYGCCYFVAFRWIGYICLSSTIICGIAKKAHKYDRNLCIEYSCRMELYWLGCSTCLGISQQWRQEMNEQTKADLIFYTELYVDAGYDYEEAERMAKDLLRVIGVIFDEDKVI